MKTAISIPDNVFHDADTAAQELKISRSELYATAVAEYLARRSAEQITDRLDRVYAEVDGTPDQAMAAHQPRTAPRTDLW
jgi:metal-responsive CopG/Arc/MetJ family transcriptional regulator